MRAALKVAAIALVASASWCDGKGPDFFLPGATSPQFGSLSGTVASGATPLAGANITLSGTPARSTTSNSMGIYNFLDLSVGPYSITTTLNGFT